MPEPIAWCAGCGRALYAGDTLCPPDCGKDRDTCAAPDCDGDHEAEVVVGILDAQVDMGDEHECVFVEEQEPSGRLILPPCLICGLTALDALEQLRGDR